MTRKSAKHRTASEWKTLIAEYAQSGLTIKQFCEEKDLVVSNFYAWRKRLKSTTNDLNFKKGHAAPLFVELETKREPEHAPTNPIPDWDAELQIGSNIILRVRQ